MARRLWHEMTHPALDRDGRRLTGLVMVLTGLTRVFVPPIVPLTWMSDRLYGALAIALGIGILMTSGARWHRCWAGRIVALLGSGLLIAWALDLGFRATVFWAFMALGYVLFREAVRE